MGTDKSNDNEEPAADTAADRRLRDDQFIQGPQAREAADHMEYEKTRNPDTELRLDGESDSLYDDGLDIGDDSDTLAGTHGGSPDAGFKP